MDEHITFQFTLAMQQLEPELQEYSFVIISRTENSTSQTHTTELVTRWRFERAVSSLVRRMALQRYLYLYSIDKSLCKKI